MEEIIFDFKGLADIAWSQKKILILVLIIFILLGVIYAMYIVEPMYKSSTTLILSKLITSDVEDENFITQDDITINQKLVSTYAEIMRSHEIATRIIENLGLNLTAEDISKKIAVSSVNDTVIIKIEVTDEDPKLAADIANEAAKVFGEEIERIYNIQNISIIDKAKESNKPYNINYIRDVIIFALIGIVFDVFITLLILYFDTTIKSADEIEKEFEIPVLGVIGKFDDDVDKCADKITVGKKKRRK